MKLLVDSGSTKADWTAIDNNGKTLFSAETLGLNPEVLTKEQVLDRINDKFDISHNRATVTHLFFYGAGCGTDRMRKFLTEIFQEYFTNAHISVQEDTYAAVYATTARGQQAIVGILGTGSNCSFFDGEKLHQKVDSLGYIVMDDGSGNQFGRLLLRGYFFNHMPPDLAADLAKAHNLDSDNVKHHLYKEPNPNAYLATFAKWLIQHKDHPYCRTIILAEMENFVTNYIKQFENYKEVPVNFSGSIAFYLQDELRSVLTPHGITLGNVVRRPIDGLIAYHVMNN